MRPSDKVWQDLQKRLHPPKRKRGLITSGLLLLFCLSGYLVSNPEIEPGKQVAKGTGTTLPTPTLPSSTPSIEPSTERHSNRGAGPERRLNSTAFSFGTQSATTDLLAPTTEQELFTSNNNLTGNNFTPTIVDSYSEASEQPANPNEQKASNGPQIAAAYPLTIESVTNSYRRKGLKKRSSWQFYVAPTISYRKLGENKAFLRSGSDISQSARATAYYNVNSVVTHKPNMGLEMGMTGRFPVSRKLRITGGLQVNITRYGIKAYNSPSELATIMLNLSNNGVDSLNMVTGYSNTEGYGSDWLQNLYFQVSVPVGVEYRISGNDKLNFGVATTIQPTYVLGNRAYLISSDYKNYAEVPDLTRRWNVNTSLHTFVGYNTGKVDWQVGPQVRYQLLSSFISKYPVKENLFDFGLRVGVSIAK